MDFPPETKPIPQATILLADDQPANWRTCQEILQDLGQNLVIAQSGEETLRRLEATKCAVLLLSVSMAGKGGFAMARRIRAQDSPWQVPIIFLDEEGSTFPVAQAYDLGAVDYLVKPLVPIILRSKVAIFVELFQKSERLIQVERADFERQLAAEKQKWETERLRWQALQDQEAAQELTSLNQRKDEFLAMLSHELRNPLAPIANAVQLLRQAGTRGSLADQALDMIARQLKNLKRLVDDLLDVSRITHGQIILHKEVIPLVPVVAQAVESCRHTIDARGHKLAVALAKEALPIEADPTRIEQIIGNLLTNASWYTEPRGSIHLSVTREEDNGVVRIKDTGIGIRAEALLRIFELFAQADRAPDRPQEGLGIGLTLVRRLVELHNGSVEAVSPGPGQGSEFIVRFPLVNPTPEQGPRISGARTHSGGPFFRVLVVEDNRDAARSLASVLRLRGHEVQVAYDGPAALDMASVFQPEVILLDIGLPLGMDGYEVALRLRDQPGLNKALVIAVTGFGQEEDQRRSTQAGFDYHLVKPVDLEALQELMALRLASH